ncbi:MULTISPECIES: hypothetical protein [unclassified Rathayibacter]|uniref:hypothetical protein n=1 Tax=unclassified Rathayibacter TaxID=2609250 RepID=UPI0006F390F8|nr:MULTISPECIES: hypothetical protein [unclassified Rathayibacter]KQQ05948.1 hypothetical protein ASF42_05260 [Rathayibacter sp. Leaf294]KQS13805.1 hypothetical protein ASG06_05270 [Rathayibacter sp. Leaf185]
MRGRAVILAGLCGVGLTMLGCARAEAPTLPTFGETEPAPEGAVYRSFYRGAVEAYMESRARWLEDGTGFELTITASGNCPLAPAALEVTAVDHLRIETQHVPGTQGCTEDAALWSYVFDTPSGLDADLPIQVDIVLERGTATEVLEPVEARRQRLLE